jgi:hypothetical protein
MVDRYSCNLDNECFIQEREKRFVQIVMLNNNLTIASTLN